MPKLIKTSILVYTLILFGGALPTGDAWINLGEDGRLQTVSKIELAASRADNTAEITLNR
ncbi:hypothetical protein [Poriferisphaera corsica]|nr:hypothetical protein [Poriferisphaera corsica]